MKEEHKKLYSRDEVKLLGELDALFEEWRKTVGDKEDSWFIPDGFYPKYLVQKPKIAILVLLDLNSCAGTFAKAGYIIGSLIEVGLVLAGISLAIYVVGLLIVYIISLFK